jgi:hypothetical protein
MNLLYVLIAISSFSFISYGISHFLSSSMKNEFKRFGLEKFGALTAFLEIGGAIGSLVGIWFNPLLLFSSAGLATLMFLGLIVRIRLKDSALLCLPAFFFMLLNTFIFYLSIGMQNSSKL